MFFDGASWGVRLNSEGLLTAGAPKVRQEPQAGDFAKSYWSRPGGTEHGLEPLKRGDVDQAEFRRLADNLPTLCWIADGDGYIVWYNRRWHDYCGTTPAEMEGWGWTSAHDPEVLPEVLERWRGAIGAGEPFEMTFPLRGADGIFRPFLTRVAPMKDQHGVPVRWFGNNVDVSAQRQAETALRESEQRLHLALSGGHGIGTWDWDIVNDRVVADSPLSSLYGVDQERAKLGAPIAEFFRGVPEDDRRVLQARIEAALATGAPFSAEYRLTQADGSIRWVEAKGQCVFSKDGTPFHFPGVSFDITERKAAEEALRQLNLTLEQRVAERTSEILASETRLRAILETSHQYQGLLNLEGEVLFANGTALAGIGATAESVIGMPFWETPWFTETPRMGEAVRQAFLEVAQGRSVQQEMLLKLPIGWRSFDFAMRPILDDRGAVAAIVPEAVDITDRRHAEEALRQSQKLEAIGQLTGGLAHDFNNLMTIIRSSTDFLRRRDITEDRRRRYIDAISDTVDRASKLTSQLLAFARRQPLVPEIFDVGKQVEIVADLIRPLVGGRVEIDIEHCNPDCFANSDVGQFEAALVNLAVNGRDAMNGEGRLVFKVAAVEAIPALRGQTRRGGTFIAVSVIDTGTGISPERLDQIFEPFYTTKEVGKGTGLGLSQAFGFAKQSGGDIEVVTALGQGSTFTLYLPQADAPGARDAAGPATGEIAALGHGHCVLVVEDNADVGRFSTEMLHDLGYSTRWVANAKDALAALAQNELAFDLVFSDVIMPGMDGVQLAEAIRERFPGLPVVLTSGYSDALARNGQHGFELIQKPYSVELLSRVLRKAISRRRTAGLS